MMQIFHDLAVVLIYKVSVFISNALLTKMTHIFYLSDDIYLELAPSNMLFESHCHNKKTA